MNFIQIKKEFKREYKNGNYENALQLALDLENSDDYKRYVEDNFRLEQGKNSALDLPIFCRILCLFRLERFDEMEKIFKKTDFWKHSGKESFKDFNKESLSDFFNNLEKIVLKYF